MPLDTRSIQGLLFRGYRRQRFATFLLLRVADSSETRVWLASVLEDPALHFASGKPGDHVLHLAFTRTGLEKLGVAPRHLATFGPPFFEGMDSPHRTRRLGDTGPNAPTEWAWGRATDPIDVLLAVYSVGEKAHCSRVQAERARAEPGLELVKALSASPFPEESPGSSSLLHEHFGFADGISQPAFDGSGLEGRLSADERRLHLVPAGEFVLGQTNAYGRVTPVPRISDEGPAFGINGSFLVFRQLAQDVGGFWSYFDSQAQGADPRSDPDAATRLAAKAVGRWRDGSPLTTCPHGPDPDQGRRNDFGFQLNDQSGERCPIGSHVRRSNPRDSKELEAEAAITFANTHRILRRGRSYGERVEDLRSADDAPRGLLFLCLCANLERQFEFVQQSWIDNDTFDGLQGETDPLIGTRPEGGGRFSIQGQPVRRRLTGVPEFVTTRGGAYFFLPGREGLAELAQPERRGR